MAPPLRFARLALAALLAFFTAAKAAEPITNSLGMKLLPISAGQFVMGSELKPANWDERPLHTVVLTTPFFMAETEVTAEQFHQFKPDAPLNPAYAPFAAGLSWKDAAAFCEWLSKKEGKNYRLPTEAEWEFVCRAGRTDDSAWPAAAQAPNPWGVRNLLSGPVEWCSDWYGEYDFAPERDPTGYSGGLVKVVRGGYLDTKDKSKPIDYLRPSNRAGAPPSFGPSADGQPNPDGFGLHRIGFRVVLASAVAGPTHPFVPPYARQGVKQTTAGVEQGPDLTKPYFRRRRMLPIPPEDEKNQAAINHAGLHPSFRDHSHSPGFDVLPNGDALLIIYTSYSEYEPEVSLISARLRFGAEEWDMPSPMFDTPGANDHAPLVWHDGNMLRIFWGNPYAEGYFPFQYVTSQDFGATWSEVTYPHITGPLAGNRERPQPINTVIKDRAGTLYLATDAAGSRAMLWATKDNGATWFDTLGRTDGRHTTFALMKDGRILGMGGKGSNIDDFMPKSISSDSGKSYTFSKTPFSQLNSGQRPSLLRLKSGRLFFAGDYQPSKNTHKPATITDSGSYVALSDDDGDTWHIKRLPGAFSLHRNEESVGYSVARQAPNGMIHLITSLNHPALHFELNEAWIMDPATLADNDPRMDQSTSTRLSNVIAHRENYPDGQPHLTWSSGLGDDGRVLLDGLETWLYPGGSKQHVTTYHLGQKRGQETFWTAAGIKQWEWNHHDDGTSDWTTYWSDGTKRSTSIWKNHELIPGTDKFFDHPAER